MLLYFLAKWYFNKYWALFQNAYYKHYYICVSASTNKSGSMLKIVTDITSGLSSTLDMESIVITIHFRILCSSLSFVVNQVLANLVGHLGILCLLKVCILWTMYKRGRGGGDIFHLIMKNVVIYSPSCHSLFDLHDWLLLGIIWILDSDSYWFLFSIPIRFIKKNFFLKS